MYICVYIYILILTGCKWDYTCYKCGPKHLQLVFRAITVVISVFLLKVISMVIGIFQNG